MRTREQARLQDTQNNIHIYCKIITSRNIHPLLQYLSLISLFSYLRCFCIIICCFIFMTVLRYVLFIIRLLIFSTFWCWCIFGLIMWIWRFFNILLWATTALKNKVILTRTKSKLSVTSQQCFVMLLKISISCINSCKQTSMVINEWRWRNCKKKEFHYKLYNKWFHFYGIIFVGKHD